MPVFRLASIALAATAFSVLADALPRWKIVYGTAEGAEGRAIELLTSDVADLFWGTEEDAETIFHRAVTARRVR